MCGRQRAVQIVVGVQHGAHRADHDREIFRPASRHHRIRRNTFQCRDNPARRHRHERLVVAAAGLNHPLDLLLGRKHEGKAVAPTLLDGIVVPLIGVEVTDLDHLTLGKVRHFFPSRRPSGVDGVLQFGRGDIDAIDQFFRIQPADRMLDDQQLGVRLAGLSLSAHERQEGFGNDDVGFNAALF